MKILLTNDDGVYAPGLTALEGIAAQLSDDILTVVPEHDQSGVGPSITLHQPLRLREINSRKYSLRGTPADCVIMARNFIAKDWRPDIVLSGVNRGQNISEEILYSGTVGGAKQGAMCGITSFALSLSYSKFSEESGGLHWQTAQRYAPGLIRALYPLGPKRIYNINFPDCAAHEVQGFALTRQVISDGDLVTVEKRLDGRNLSYFWLAPKSRKITPVAGSDLEALRQKKISITSLSLECPCVSDNQEKLSALLSEMFVNST